MFHGSRTDSFRGAGSFQHSDRLVQTVSPLIIGRPDLSSSRSSCFPVIAGLFRATGHHQVLVNGQERDAKLKHTDQGPEATIRTGTADKETDGQNHDQSFAEA